MKELVYVGLLILFVIFLLANARYRARPKLSPFREGRNYVKVMLEKSTNFCRTIKLILCRIEESTTFGTFNDFDRGARSQVGREINDKLCLLNLKHGGDWYFDSEDYTFKDTLTSRQILL